MQTAATKLEVEVRDLPAQEYLGRRFVSSPSEVGPSVQRALAGLYQQIGETSSTPTGPPFLVATEPADGMMEVEVGAPCAPVPEPGTGQYRGLLQPCRAAVAVHHGPWERMATTYSSLYRWVGEHGLVPAGKAREVYLNGPDDVSSPEEYRTEVIVPIAG